MTKPLSSTQAQILASAAQHPERLAEAPLNLPTAARNAVFQSMLRAGLLEETHASDRASMMLRITAAGLAVVGAALTRAEPAGEAVTDAQEGREALEASEAAEAPVPPTAAPQPRTTLRDAAAALLTAWDTREGRPDVPNAVESLRAALSHGRATRPPRDSSAPQRPREGAKDQTVLSLLRRDGGATIAQVIEATGWAQHTVRGFLAGLKKKGNRVEVLERVRQIGPGAQGAKGSYSVYRISGEQG
jgi:hypothetical protein